MAKKIVKEDVKKTTKTSKKDVVIESTVIETGETLTDVETPVSEEETLETKETITETVKTQQEETSETKEEETSETKEEETSETKEEKTSEKEDNNTEETPEQENNSKQELEAMRECAFQDTAKQQVHKLKRDNNFTNYWNGVSDGWYN